MKKRVLTVLSLVAMTVIMMTSCGANGGGGKQKITIWAWDPKFNIAIMNEAKARFAAKNPNVEIEVVDMAKADVEQKLLINLSSGVTDGLSGHCPHRGL
jgi:lactose/L-arabinose transport system substrate-binding protein